jgi:glycosyltransferase involved in cell wall biosynthesis
MKASTSVSIIIPAFNAADTIECAVRSALVAGENFNIQIIIIDDGSVDSTWEKIICLSSEYPQILCQKNSREKGPSGARNSGLDVAIGSYVAFLDADDTWDSNHLSIGVGFLSNNPNIDVLLLNQRIFDPSSDVIDKNWMDEKLILATLKQNNCGENFFVIDDNVSMALLKESFLHLQSMICRHEIIKNIRFDEKTFRGEDLDFGVSIYSIGGKFAYSRLITGTYLRNQKSLTANSMQNDIRGYEHLRYIYKKYLNDADRYKMDRRVLRSKIFETLIRQSYPMRKLNLYSKASAGIFESVKYGYSMSQVKEFFKILILMGLSVVTKKK